MGERFIQTGGMFDGQRVMDVFTRFQQAVTTGIRPIADMAYGELTRYLDQHVIDQEGSLRSIDELPPDLFDDATIESLTVFYGYANEQTQPVYAVATLNELKRRLAEKVANATGKTPDDYLYAQAQGVRKANAGGQQVYVSYGGIEYGPVHPTYGAIDFDPEKMTALVNLGSENEPMWIKLWYLSV